MTPLPQEPAIGFAFVTYDGTPGELGVAPGERLIDAGDELRRDGFQAEDGVEIAGAR